MKTIWRKPKLVTLVRGRPEEAILTSCKLFSPPTGSSSGNSQIACIGQVGTCECCSCDCHIGS